MMCVIVVKFMNLSLKNKFFTQSWIAKRKTFNEKIRNVMYKCIMRRDNIKRRSIPFKPVSLERFKINACMKTMHYILPCLFFVQHIFWASFTIPISLCLLAKYFPLEYCTLTLSIHEDEIVPEWHLTSCSDHSLVTRPTSKMKVSISEISVYLSIYLSLSYWYAILSLKYISILYRIYQLSTHDIFFPYLVMNNLKNNISPSLYKNIIK